MGVGVGGVGQREWEVGERVRVEVGVGERVRGVGLGLGEVGEEDGEVGERVRGESGVGRG